MPSDPVGVRQSSGANVVLVENRRQPKLAPVGLSICSLSSFGRTQTMRPATESPGGITRSKPAPFLCGQTDPTSVHRGLRSEPSGSVSTRNARWVGLVMMLLLWCDLHGGGRRAPELPISARCHSLLGGPPAGEPRSVIDSKRRRLKCLASDRGITAKEAWPRDSTQTPAALPWWLRLSASVRSVLAHGPVGATPQAEMPRRAYAS